MLRLVSMDGMGLETFLAMMTDFSVVPTLLTRKAVIGVFNQCAGQSIRQSASQPAACHHATSSCPFLRHRKPGAAWPVTSSAGL
jgi:hypothetical protein